MPGGLYAGLCHAFLVLQFYILAFLAEVQRFSAVVASFVARTKLLIVEPG